jgi:hypothetical protein
MSSLPAETAPSLTPADGHLHPHGHGHPHADGHSHSHSHDGHSHSHSHDGHVHDGNVHDGHSQDGQAHSHSHDSPVEAGEPPKGGPVVLDIGGDVGAFIAYCDSDEIGTEIHVRLDGEQRTTHTGVWERDLGTSRVVVAVFPELVFGDYAILERDGATRKRITIAGGSVSEVDLRRG